MFTVNTNIVSSNERLRYLSNLQMQYRSSVTQQSPASVVWFI